MIFLVAVVVIKISGIRHGIWRDERNKKEEEEHVHFFCVATRCPACNLF
jgi:hypothetical protein